MRNEQPYPLLGKRTARITWLREFVRCSASDLAIDALYGFQRDTDYPLPGSIGGLAEVLLICIGKAIGHGDERAIGESAARAEWNSAQQRAANYAEALRRGIWTLGRDRAPGGEILARAERINLDQFERASIELQPADLLAITRQIAVAAATGRRPRGS